MYETENGTLVASCEPVRSESIGGLIEKAAVVCGNMYRTWVASQIVTVDPDFKRASNISVGGGALFASDFGGGLEYGNGEHLRTPYYGGGAYLFIDVVYVEIVAGYSTGGGKWTSVDAKNNGNLPYMSRSYVNIGIFAKYPIEVESVDFFPLLGIDIEAESVNFFPLLGIDYEASISGERTSELGTFATKESTSALWFKVGGGVDIGLSENVYLRGELLYGVRTASEFENVWKKEETEQTGLMVNAKLGHGGAVKVGVGVRF